MFLICQLRTFTYCKDVHAMFERLKPHSHKMLAFFTRLMSKKEKQQWTLLEKFNQDSFITKGEYVGPIKINKHEFVLIAGHKKRTNYSTPKREIVIYNAITNKWSFLKEEKPLKVTKIEYYVYQTTIKSQKSI